MYYLRGWLVESYEKILCAEEFSSMCFARAENSLSPLEYTIEA
jgi:hypothetical protein